MVKNQTFSLKYNRQYHYLLLSIYKILVQQMTDLTTRQQQNFPDIWPKLSEMFAASHFVME